MTDPQHGSPTPNQTALIRVELNLPDGPLRGQVEVDTGPMRLADLVPTAYELTMALSGRANRHEEQAGRPISCRAGCAACCRQLVPLSPPEAFYLVGMLDAIHPDRKRTYLARFEQIDARLEAEGMIEELFNPTVTDDPVLEVSRRYFNMAMACPFLEDECCSIHPVRPVACREYNVTSPATWCSDPYNHPIQKVPMPLPLSLPLTLLTNELFGRRFPLIPLTLAPRWVRENAAFGERTWPGLELFRQFISRFKQGPPADGRLR